MRRFSRSPFTRPGTVRIPQLSAAIALQPRTIGGDTVSDDLQVKSVTITQRDTSTDALVISSAGAAYGTNLTTWVAGAGTVSAIDSAGRLHLTDFTELTERTTPGTPSTNNVRLYAKDKAGVSELYYVNDGGTDRDLSILAFLQRAASASLTSPVSIASSAAETQLLGLTIPANVLIAGSTLFFAATGIAGTTLIAPTMTWRVRIGAASLSGNIAASWAPTPGTSLSNKGWRIDGEITVRTAGAGGTCIANGVLSDELSSTLTEALKLADQTATVAVDTTASRVLELTFQFGTSDAANVLACHNAFLGWVKP